MMELTSDEVFAELRSACGGRDHEKVHHCLRWFLLYGEPTMAQSALHYAIRANAQDTRNTFRWGWWLEFIELGRRASLQLNDHKHFRILAPDLSILKR